jgi:hypothetical protein
MLLLSQNQLQAFLFPKAIAVEKEAIKRTIRMLNGVKIFFMIKVSLV